MSNSERFTDKGRTSVFYDGMTAGKLEERERIIKLLEATALEANKSSLFTLVRGESVNRRKLAAVCYMLIKLIKGEPL